MGRGWGFAVDWRTEAELSAANPVSMSIASRDSPRLLWKSRREVVARIGFGGPEVAENGCEET